MWWAYLKRNELYLETCEAGGKGICADVYTEFGDVRGDDFKKWWTEGERGAKLFAEPVKELFVRQLEEGEAAMSNDKFISLLIPLNLPKRDIAKRVAEILSKHHQGMRGKLYSRHTQARKLEYVPSIKSLKKALAIYDYRKAHPDYPLWKIGNEQPFLNKFKLLPTDTKYEDVNKKKILSITVSRYYSKAKLTIDMVGFGKFP